MNVVPVTSETYASYAPLYGENVSFLLNPEHRALGAQQNGRPAGLLLYAERKTGAEIMRLAWVRGGAEAGPALIGALRDHLRQTNRGFLTALLGTGESRVLGPLLEREGFWKTGEESFCWEAFLSDLEPAVRAARSRPDILPLRDIPALSLQQLLQEQQGAVQLGRNALDQDASHVLFMAGKIQAALLLSGRPGETRVLELFYLRNKQFSGALLSLLRAVHDSLIRTDGPSAAIQIAGVSQAERLLLRLAPHARRVPFPLYRYSWLAPDYEARLIRQADEDRLLHADGPEDGEEGRLKPNQPIEIFSRLAAGASGGFSFRFSALPAAEACAPDLRFFSGSARATMLSYEKGALCPLPLPGRL